MFYKLPFFESSKVARFIYGLLFIGFAFVAFALDLYSQDAISFYLFYFPSILLLAWYFGGRAGFLMAILSTIMWEVAQGDTESWSSHPMIYVLNGVVHLAAFLFVGGMMTLVRRKALQLNEKSLELARSNTELEQFAFKAAHDLQSPLSTIYGFSELLAEKREAYQPNGKETQQCATAILKGAKRMSVMIKELLDYSRVMKEDFKAPAADLNKVVREVIETLEALITEKKAEIIVDPLPVAAMNPGLAGILLQNLIANAIKYCEKIPRVQISASRKGKEWLFAVRDNGIGIPEEDRERVFIMFEKLPNQRQYSGSGIGLATCQKIVSRYGGRIWVETSPEGGSVFYFTLPASQDPAAHS